MARSPLVWLAALWIGVLVHLDWHLARTGHDHLSFGWPYHWLLAFVTFTPLPWILLRRWPRSLPQASTLVLLIGIALGQGLEPLGEVVVSSGSWAPFTNPARWRAFAEFSGAGMLIYVASAALAVRWRSAAA